MKEEREEKEEKRDLLWSKNIRGENQKGVTMFFVCI